MTGHGSRRLWRAAAITNVLNRKSFTYRIFQISSLFFLKQEPKIKRQRKSQLVAIILFDK